MISLTFKKDLEKMVYCYFELAEAPLENIDITILTRLKHLICDLEERMSTSKLLEKEHASNIEMTRDLILSMNQRNKIKLMIESANLFYDIIINYAKQKNMNIQTL
ncbi:hypothetical protein BH23THE1_BH23THE1_27540 [soil metagenome]